MKWNKRFHLLLVENKSVETALENHLNQTLLMSNANVFKFPSCEMIIGREFQYVNLIWLFL